MCGRPSEAWVSDECWPRASCTRAGQTGTGVFDSTRCRPWSEPSTCTASWASARSHHTATIVSLKRYTSNWNWIGHCVKRDSLTFLKSLLVTPGLSACEAAPARVWRAEAEKFADSVRADV